MELDDVLGTGEELDELEVLLQLDGAVVDLLQVLLLLVLERLVLDRHCADVLLLFVHELVSGYLVVSIMGCQCLSSYYLISDR